MESVIEFLRRIADDGIRLSVQEGRLNCYVPKGSLTDEIKSGIVAYRSEIVELLSSGRPKRMDPEPGQASTERGEFTLSAGQKGIYILHNLQPGMSAYNMPLCFRIDGAIDVANMRKSWEFVLESFPILTAKIVERDGVLYHRLSDDCKTTLQFETLHSRTEDDLQSFLKNRAKEPFDLHRGPLTRIEMYDLGDDKSILLINVHHIVFDGASVMIMLRVFLDCYMHLCEGRQYRLVGEQRGYQDFVAWEDAMLSSAEGEAHARYWRQKLDGELPVVEILPDIVRSSSPGFEGKTFIEEMPEGLFARANDFCKGNGLPTSVFFLAVLQMLLRRYTGQQDIIIGMPVMGRAAGMFAADVGYFINMIPIRAFCDEKLKLLDYMRKVHGAMLDSLYHSSYPFPRMLENLKSKQMRKNPVFQVTYIMHLKVEQSKFSELLEREALKIDYMEIFQEGDSDFGLEIFEDDFACKVHIKYNPELYSEGMIKRFHDNYCVMIDAIIENPGLYLHEYPAVSPSERHRLLSGFNGSPVEYEKRKCTHDMFVERVAVCGDELAVVFGDQQLTYRELYEKSGDLALYLQSQGIGKESLVGLCMNRTLDMIVGLFGILRAGGAYVPLDPEYPEDRLAYMLEDSRARIVLTQGVLLEKLSGLVGDGTHVVALDRQWPEIEREVAQLKSMQVCLRHETAPDNLAYVIYTSGSTGKPKGVAIEHRSIVALINWSKDVYSEEELGTVLASTSICFDLSVYEIFVTLALGGKIVLVPNALAIANLANKDDITLINTVPSAMDELMRMGVPLDKVQVVNLCGEALSAALVDKIYANTSARKVIDLYGPSEDTVYSTYTQRRPNAPATIGRPIANTQVYILDQYNNPQPIGAAGELHIAGDGLARGYLNRPELSDERFVPNPFDPGTRMYKTGDLARWMDDGNLQFLGRIDTQVKIRGFRIETGEIEARLNEHPGIVDSVVIPQDHAGSKQLVAFYVAKETEADGITALPVESIRTHLQQTLPEYMVPVAFVSIAAVPQTPNGKTDRRALSRIDVSITSDNDYLAPRNETEQRLAQIWAQVLNLSAEKIGVHDNFFELGGHSLLATQLISQIRMQLDVELPLKMVFEATTIAELGVLIAGAGQSGVPPIVPIDRSRFDALPLSYAQERIWFLTQLEPDSAGYNVPAAATIRGELNLDWLERAFDLTIARHENLRTVFPSHDGRPRQRIMDRAAFKLERIDLSHDDNDEARDAEAHRLCLTAAATPFDLEHGPLIRAMAVRLCEDRHILMLNMHHIISDGWSLGVLFKEIGAHMDAFRQGREAEMPPLPIQYVDYSVWQRSWLEEGGVLERQLAYWNRKLAGVPERLDLATDYPRPSLQNHAGASFAFAMDAALTEQLKSLAEQHGGTLYMVLLAAFNALLYRYTGQEDICVGSPIANRQYGETEGLIGMFVNTLALRNRVRDEDVFADLLLEVKATCLEAYEHQDAPFEKVVDAIQPQREMAITPLFQVMLILQNTDMGEALAQHELYPLGNGVSGFDLSVDFTETSAGLSGTFEYSTALYKPQTIERMAGHFVDICRAVVLMPTAKIRDLDFMSEAQKRRLLVEFNATAADYRKDACIHDLFVEQVESDPDRIAAVHGEDALSYRALYERSRDLALHLQAEGVGPGVLVGLSMERSLDMLVGLLGILQAGGAYLPLDPDYPDERLAYMIEDSGTAILLTQAALQGRLAGLSQAGTRLVMLDAQWADIASRAAGLKAAGARLRQDVGPEDLAYVIYTSGSTGKPKGVLVQHGSLVNHNVYARRKYGIARHDVQIQSSSIGFDLFLEEVFVVLNSGAQLVVDSKTNLLSFDFLETLVKDRGVTALNLPTAFFHQLVASNFPMDGVKTIIVGGEELSYPKSKDFVERHPEISLYNTYGPTETTIISTALAVAAESIHDGCPIPIGGPIANTRIYILDRCGNPQPIGVPGELHIAGDGLARGYLNRPELTEEKFVANPFEPGARMYRTGDLARWLDDGNLQYLGRIDTQVKIRGFRIEMGEIEARLNQHPGIQDCVVIAQGQEAGKHLVAFYLAEGTRADHVVEWPQDDLRTHLSQALPEHMVPAAYVSLPEIPLNQNGKVDRLALSRLDVSLSSSHAYVAPRDATERQLAEIWSQVLQRDAATIGVHDNFFELGGHSLLATQVISKIRSRLDVELPLKALFESSSIAQLAKSVSGASQGDAPAVVPVIAPVDRTQYARLPLSYAQERIWFIGQLEPDSAGYNIPGAVVIRGALDEDRLERAFDRIVARHENLRTVFPSEDGLAQQLILAHTGFKLERIDLGHYKTRKARDNKARQLCHAEASQPFDLARGPLLRVKTIKLSDDEHILMFNMHHIIGDGWSLGVLIDELSALMAADAEGREADLPALPIQYADYAVWQRKWLEEGGELERQLGYWRGKLSGLPESLDLATDYPRPSVQRHAGATHGFALDAAVTGRLKAIAEQQGGTLFMALLAAFKTLLYRYTGQEDICVGSPIANRQYGETEGLIGMFVNTLALRDRVSGEDGFVDLLEKVKATCLDAYAHQDTPFEKVVDAVQPQRNMAISPLFQTMLVLQNAASGAVQSQHAAYALEHGISKFDLTLDFTETADGLSGSLEYSTALYSSATAERLASHFVSLCDAIAASPNAKLRDLEYIGAGEKHRLLVGFNDTAAEYRRDVCIHELFEEQVGAHPERLAVSCGEESLSYGELYARSSDLALYLQAQGVGPDTLVGLCLERANDMMVAIMGTVLAGGAYLPLDPAYPDDRLSYMLQDSASVVVLTQARFEARIRSLSELETTLLAMDERWSEVEASAAHAKLQQIALRRDVGSRNLCYVIYTSGSTGKPKGVLVEHQALVNRLVWMQQAYPLDRSDIVLQKTPYSFDVSVWEFFWPMITGASVVFAAPEGHKDVQYLEALIDRAKVTTLHYVPSMLYAFLDHADLEHAHLEHAQGRCASVRQIFCSGEALDKKGVDAYPARFPNAVLHNLYGPTEAAIDVTYYDCSKLSHPFVPIGMPISNTQIYVLDEYKRPQPIGVPGELHIAGDGLARGYLNRPELTEEKFVANPFEPGARMYRTGDLARWLDDGNLQYLGRIDTQVKIRGFRIEMGEIEARLNQHPGIQDCALIAQGQDANKQLIAFYRARETNGEQLVQLPYEALTAHLSQTLPEYMVPAAFVSVAAIPLGSSGKVDRLALSRLDVSLSSSHAYVAPRDATERELAEIWSQVLQRDAATIGVHDNFFELGGHSLLATQVISKIRSRLDVELPLKALFESSSIAQLAKSVSGASQGDAPAVVPVIAPVDRTQYARLPLSYAQERIWFIGQLEPDSAGYNIPGAVVIRGALDEDRLERAFDRIVARHENLRTVFPSEDGLAQQLILAHTGFKLERIDLGHYKTRKARDNKARQLCHAEASQPFDLARGPLLRVKTIKLSDDEHILMFNMHHIIGDGWSLGVLIDELSALMAADAEGREADLPALPIQYADYAVWQRKWLEEGGELERQLGYWRGKLSGLPESLDLATDYPRPSVQRHAGATHGFALDAAVTGRLKAIAEQQGGTLFMALLAAFKTLLYRYTGQEDICVGSPIANRQYGETEGLIGMFVNTLALRDRVSGEDGFVDLLEKVKATCLDAYAHQDTPFEKVVDAVQPQRNMAISPLFQTMLVLQNAASGAVQSQHAAYALEHGISKFDLTLDFTETADGLSGSLEYSTALYSSATAERLASHFVSLCDAIAASPNAKLRDLEYIGAGEKHRLLVGFNDTAAEYRRDVCIHELFEEQVGAHPERLAVSCGEESLSYGELYARSSDLALYLQAQGVGPDTLVGLCMERSTAMMVGLLAILQAGGAYVPLDPEYPDDRLAHMIEDSRVAMVLTQETLRKRLRGFAAETVELIALDAKTPAAGKRSSKLKSKSKKVQLRRDVEQKHLAYVIYTSGSTGKPKGVMIEHRSLMNYLSYCTKHYFPEGSRRYASFLHFPLTFDASVTSLLAPFALGKAIDIHPKSSIETFKDADVLNEGYDFIKLTPGHLQLLKAGMEGAASGVVKKKNLLVVGGEALARDHFEFLNAIGADVEIVNEYGPTEATVGCTTLRFQIDDRDHGGSKSLENIGIGKPIDNTRIYILDPNGRPQPIGVPGELHIAGDGLARGYFNRPELTEEKFVANPFEPGARMYRTGDLARWLDDGNLQYLGRIDTQVKIRGFRIETGEIEARLNQHPDIEESVVVVQEQGGNKQLVAFVRAAGAATAGTELPVDALKAYLAQALPDYMMPAAFVGIGEIPLTQNGKVDRLALARIDVAIGSGHAYVAPRNATERQLIEIWAQVLNLSPDSIGVNDNFFELGGHSLSAAQLMAKVNRTFGRLLPLAILFTAPSIAAIAKQLSSGDAHAFDILVPIQAKGDHPPVFAVPGVGGNVLSLRPLSDALGKRQPLYGLQAVGLDGAAAPLRTVEMTAEANIEAIRNIQPEGPYRLVGHSYGGVVAYEMARQLQEKGEKVSSLILLDSIAPSIARQTDMGSDDAADLADACSTIAHLYGASLDLDTERLRALPQHDWIGIAVSSLNDIGLEVEERQFSDFHGVFKSNLKCYRLYEPLALAGAMDISLYRATIREDADRVLPEDYGWNALAQGGVAIHAVHADHFSMLEAGAIDVVAAALNDFTEMAV